MTSRGAQKVLSYVVKEGGVQTRSTFNSDNVTRDRYVYIYIYIFIDRWIGSLLVRLVGDMMLML